MKYKPQIYAKMWKKEILKLTKMLLTEARISEVIKIYFNKLKITSVVSFSLWKLHASPTKEAFFAARSNGWMTRAQTSCTFGRLCLPVQRMMYWLGTFQKLFPITSQKSEVKDQTPPLQNEWLLANRFLVFFNPVLIFFINYIWLIINTPKKNIWGHDNSTLYTILVI